MIGLNRNVRPVTMAPPAVAAPAGLTVPLADLKAQYALLRDEILPALDEVACSTSYVLGPKVREFEDGLLSLLRGKNVDILNAIRDSRDLSDDTAAKLKTVVEGYAKSFAA